MRPIARAVRESVAFDCVMNKIEKKRGLVGPSYGTHALYTVVDARAYLPASRGDPLLVESAWSRGHVLEGPKDNLKQRNVAKNNKSVETASSGTHRGKAT